MTQTPPTSSKRRTGDDALDAAIAGLVDSAAGEHTRLGTELLVAAVGLLTDGPHRLDLKIATAALQEMRDAYSTFAPYRGAKKVTVFGSARTQPHDKAYEQAYDVAKALAEMGWMVVTGAGPGIMIAANEGAGLEMSFGVNIRLPFETEVNALLHGDEKLVEMKYFFTRKLMLIKESQGFIALPGGFGTLDETFELLTLQQTGKADPSPIVMLDVPGGTYWSRWHDYVLEELEANGMVNPADRELYTITDNVEVACAAISDFWTNYHSIRYVGDRLVVRMQHEITDEALADINREFGHLVDRGSITRSPPLGPEVDDDDVLALPRLAFAYGNRHYGKLHPLIRAVNQGSVAN
ncbi:MAG: TIGR00730 family Rossman fold protein [Actinobacteria bacterium]|nr:TIGR00730 family Rossman fold protein [Actinomycetota bacterium]